MWSGWPAILKALNALRCLQTGIDHFPENKLDILVQTGFSFNMRSANWVLRRLAVQCPGWQAQFVELRDECVRFSLSLLPPKTVQVNKRVETINRDLKRETAYKVMEDLQTADPNSTLQTVCRLVGEKLTVSRTAAAHLLNRNSEEQNVP